MKKIRKGFSIFNGKTTRMGGHSQWLSKITKLDYLSFDFGLWGIKYDHYWYEGQHHTLTLVFVRFMWGGLPIVDDKE
jgi:hypothetical protein